MTKLNFSDFVFINLSPLARSGWLLSTWSGLSLHVKTIWSFCRDKQWESPHTLSSDHRDTEVYQRYISYSQPANQYRQRLSSSFLSRGKLSSQLTHLLLTDHIEKLKLLKTATFLAKNNIIFGISIKICFIYLLAGLGWKILRRNDFSFGPLWVANWLSISARPASLCCISAQPWTIL